MIAFKKFAPQAFLERERLAPDSTKTLATLATLAGPPLENETRTIPKPMSQWDNGVSAAKSRGIQSDDPIVEHGLDHLRKNQKLTPTPAKVAKVAKAHVLPQNFSNFSRPPSKLIGVARAHKDALHALLETRRDRLEERAAILEFDEGLSRAETEAIARGEMAAGIYDITPSENDTGPYAFALTALRAKCPAYVPEDRWHQAIADAMTFSTKWSKEAQAFGWTVPELFGLHPVPERPAPSYGRLSRYDEAGLIWLLRSRPVVALTETTAAIQSATAVLTYRKINKPALGPVGDSLDDWGAT